MIEKLRIENFKGIKEGELSLSPLTILLGANNSGKTTVLEALFLAPNPFRYVPYYLPPYSGAVEFVKLLHETLVSRGFSFLLNNYTAEKAKIECKVNEVNFSLEFTVEGQRIHVTAGEGTEETRGLGYLHQSEDRAGKIKIKKPFIDNTFLISPKLIEKGYRYLREKWAFIVNLGVCRRVAEEVSKLSPEKYKDITIEPFLDWFLVIYAYLEDGRRIRLGDLGEGVQNYMLSRILFEAEKPEVLLWDDVEAHLNPRVLLSVGEWFSDIVKDGKQIIVSTHSLEATETIAGLNEEARIYLLSSDKNILKAKELTLEEVKKLKEAGIDVRVAEPVLL